MQSLSPRLLLILLCIPSLLSPAIAGVAEPSLTAATGEEAWTHLLRGESEAAARAALELLAREREPARAAVCLAEALSNLGRPEEAFGRLKEYETRHPGSGIELLGRGRIELLRRHFAPAESLSRVALESIAARGDSLAELVAREQMGDICREAVRLGEAEAHFKASLSLATALGQELSVAAARYGLAYSDIGAGKHAAAERQLGLAREAATRRNLPLWIGHIEALLAVVRLFEADVDRAARHFTTAYDAYGRAGNRSRQASTLRKLAGLSNSQGDIPLSIQRLRRAEELARAAGDLREASFCTEHLGTANHLLGNVDLAFAQWEEALRTGRELWPREWLVAPLVQMASALVEGGRCTEALAHLEEAAAVIDQVEVKLALPDVLTRMARCRRESGAIEPALATLARAIDSSRRQGLPVAEGLALAEVGLCHLAAGRLEEASRALTAAERLTKGRGLYEVDLAVLSGEAKVARARDDPEAALAFLEKALGIAEDVRRRSRLVTAIQQGVFTRTAHIYEATVDLLATMHRNRPGAGFDRRAFVIAQRAKSRSFLDLLAETALDLRVRADPAIQEREQAILARIVELDAASGTNGKSGKTGKTAKSGQSGATARDELARLEDELAILEQELRAADPRYAELRYPRPSSIQEIQEELLGDGDLLLDYALGDSTSHLWAVTTKSFRMITLPARASIESAVRALLPLIADYNLLGPDATYFVTPARKLAQTLLGEVRDDLEGAERVIVAPHGILHYVPFEVLPLDDRPPAAPERDFGLIPYLVTRADVSYTSSASALAHLAPRRVTPRGQQGDGRDLLLIGNPVLADGGGTIAVRAATGRPPAPLESAAREMEVLARFHAGGRARVLSGAVASKTDLKRAAGLGRYRYVHFATHGVYNERRPRFSGLLMSTDPGDARDDGFLSLGEVFALDLECDQVVLSACSTALGERVTGEGLVGLTRAFHYAGARSVVAALWEVAGEATSHFMADFYAEIERAGAGTSGSGVHALAEAKRRMIRRSALVTLAGGHRVDFAHPAFWSAFVLSGSGGARPN